jgi:rhodanese-related sulfurtransferase
VARQLKKAGYGDVRIMRGGLAAWASAGLPLEQKPA